MPLLICGCWLSPGGGESVGPSWSRIWHNELPMCRRQRWQERTPIWWLQDDRYQRSWWQARTPIWWLQDDYDEGSCCCHSCQNRKGECRESWYRHGDKPVAAPSQVEEADHLFSSLQPLTNYRVNNELSKVFWRNASQKKWSNSTTSDTSRRPATSSN